MSDAAQSHFRYAERLPDASLTPWIACYWEFSASEGAPEVHHVPPDGCTSFLIPQGGPHAGTLLYSGPWLEPLKVPVYPGLRFVGIRLRPGAAALVLDMSITRMRNAALPAFVAGGAIGSALQRTLPGCVGPEADLDADARSFDAYWMGERDRFTRPDALVSSVVDSLVMSNGIRRIAELARDNGCSERTLLRRFRAATALSPKEFARVRRVLAASWHAVDGIEHWGRIAAEAGYADHAHLHHEVKELLGIRPEQLGAQLRDTQRIQVSRRLPDGV